jgi:hypothetical protein
MHMSIFGGHPRFSSSDSDTGTLAPQDARKRKGVMPIFSSSSEPSKKAEAYFSESEDTTSRESSIDTLLNQRNEAWWRQHGPRQRASEMQVKIDALNRRFAPPGLEHSKMNAALPHLRDASNVKKYQKYKEEEIKMSRLAREWSDKQRDAQHKIETLYRNMTPGEQARWRRSVFVFVNHGPNRVE